MLPNIEKTKIFQLYSLPKTTKTFVFRQHLPLINQALHFTAHFQPITFTLLPLFARNHAIPNIVGYTQKDAPQGKFMIFGAGFEQVAGGMNVNGLVSGVEGVDNDVESAFMSTAAQIQIPTAEGYNVYYYLNDGWYQPDPVKSPDDWQTKPGWCDDYGVLVDTEITPGVAFWFKSVPGDADCVVSGGVSGDATADVECPAGFALRANPFPVAVKVNGGKFTSTDIVGVNNDVESAFMATAPQIQIPTENGYDVYYYLNDGWYQPDPVNSPDDWQTKPGWCDDYGVLVDAEIPAGQGIWTKGVSGAFTLTFTK